MNDPQHLAALEQNSIRPDQTSELIVGMSGGVDSSVAALLLRKQGYDMAGLFMKNWEEDDFEGHCTATEDFADAKSICAQLGIKLYERNFSAEYWDNVFTEFLSSFYI